MSGLVVDFLFFVSSWVYVLLAPYTKVEESFNLHAVHDILMYGVSPKGLLDYDHNVFPGAIPRTFTGNILLSWIITPFLHAGIVLGVITSKFDLQVTLRLVLASLNALVLILVRKAVSTRFGRQASWWYSLLMCSQFHLLFWMGRTIPNMFALLPVNIAYYLLYNRPSKSLQTSKKCTNTAIGLLTFTAVIFRSEVVLLLVPLGLQLLVGGHATFFDLFKVGLLVGLVSIAITLFVDSYFWDQWLLWPELYGLYFNVILGKSADWGISPPHTYFTVYLPKLLLGATPMAVLGAVLDPRVRSMLVPSLVFISILSVLGHKEWRFIIYVIPIFNIAAARGARWMTSRKKSFLFKHFTLLCVLSLISLNFFATILSLRASVANYPGGVALTRFNERYSTQEHVHVHISNLAAQTGASLFLHEHASPFLPLSSNSHSSQLSWTYNKTEGLTPTMISSSTFTHLIAESPEMVGEEWTVAEVIPAFGGWKLNTTLLNKLKVGKVWEIPLNQWVRVLEMEMSDRLWILERRPVPE